MTRIVRCCGVALTAVLVASALDASADETNLVAAMKRGDKAAVVRMIRERVDVNRPDVDGATPLHWAVRRDDAEAVSLLIRAGAKTNAANRYGVMPLTLAAINGNGAIIDALLEAGADANAMSAEGETVLMTAARTGTVAGVKSLLNHRADMNAKERWKGQTVLMWAAAEGHAPAVETLVKAGAELSARSNRGFTPLLYAVREGHLDVVRALLDAGAPPDDALQPMQGAENTRGARRDTGPATGGTTALVLAVMNAHYELAAFLLDRGADPNADGPGWTALHQITWARRPGSGANFPGPTGSGTMNSLTLVRRLVAAGANVNTLMTKVPRNGPQGFQSFLNWIGATPFLLAARAADAPLMRLLAELGANPLLSNEDDTPPLTVAAGVGVRSAGEDPGTDSEVLEAVKVAFELGGDVNHVDKNGETVMHGAAVRGVNTVIQFLVDNGAKVEIWNQKNRRGLTPLMMAEGYRRKNGSFQASPQSVPLLRELSTNSAGHR